MVTSCECLRLNSDSFPDRAMFWYGREAAFMTISAREARRRLFVLLEEVNTDHEPVRITSKAGDAVLMSSDDYDAWQETMHLFRSPENARRLMEAVARDRSGRPRK